MCVRVQGTTALVGTEGGEVCMYSLVDGSCELVMASANEPVTAINVAWNVSAALSSPITAIGHMTGGIIVWDLMGEPEDLPICQFKGHKAGVSGLAFFARGECLVSSSLDGTVIVWNMLTGKRSNVLLGHSAPVNGVLVRPFCVPNLCASVRTCCYFTASLAACKNRKGILQSLPNVLTCTQRLTHALVKPKFSKVLVYAGAYILVL